VENHLIRTVEEYRELRGDGSHWLYDKSMKMIDDHIRDFLAMTTFITVASSDAEGRMDVSPKGDPAGFIQVVDDLTIAIPERERNRRADTFTNVLQNPNVALICLVPGMNETMRINGTASLTTEPSLLASMTHDGHEPPLAMLVHVEEAFIHCGKAQRRGRLWDVDAQIDRSTYPKMGEVMHDHGRYEDVTRERMAEVAQWDYDNNMYPTDVD